MVFVKLSFDTSILLLQLLPLEQFQFSLDFQLKTGIFLNHKFPKRAQAPGYDLFFQFFLCQHTYSSLIPGEFLVYLAILACSQFWDPCQGILTLPGNCFLWNFLASKSYISRIVIKLDFRSDVVDGFLFSLFFPYS